MDSLPKCCMKSPSNSANDRFERGADKYASYLDTPEGRLRTDLAQANLQDYLPALQAMESPRALDIGCGTGAAAVRLARLGYQVTQLDSSEAMLDIARGTAEEAGVTNAVTLLRCDALQLMDLFDAASFDMVLCHNILEYVDDAATVLRGAARVLRGTSAILSIVARNRAGEVLKAAIQNGDLEAAERYLTAQWGSESLYGGRVRLLTPTELEAMLNAESLEVIAHRGIRVVADYLPSQVSRSAEYERIFELERKLGKLNEFSATARYTQYLVRRTGKDS